MSDENGRDDWVDGIAGENSFEDSDDDDENDDE